MSTIATSKDAVTQAELRSYAFNIDAGRESDLRRVARDKLERPRARDSRAGTILLRAPGDSYEEYKNKMPDASESPWLYLLFLVILVVEQALAVHLSFHLKGNEAVPGTTATGSASWHSSCFRESVPHDLRQSWSWRSPRPAEAS